ncbi:asparagine synthase (glutamine-hydrolyzing) [Paractinoplanes globisporus]|uniref:asparagine synthase (glutamine-hydrolyzing) n=1 Tax=Paractinoplanes globisporus TaxID=113565 RepID=UPI001B7FC821|nr:asparagine synthase (glutamine-hydrolyzing) [Actinoplanes globisporus]
MGETGLMCGITGILRLRGGVVSPDRLTAMARAIAHRGPDDEGFHADGPLGFGFRRLSIMDPAGGPQPMTSADGRLTVMVNGEIYNFPELRSELEGYGHVFRTRSDSEVVLHGYREWGDGILDRLNGMFALAVWDSAEERLLLARDRAGVKFLYYRVVGDELVFGSELRAVLAGRPDRPAIDPVAMNLFLRYRYVPSPLTVYKGVHKLASGTRLVVKGGKVDVRRYWDFDLSSAEPEPTPEEAAERLLELYATATRRQLMSDVPVGLLLSGGVDSALLLALMSEHGTGRQTYTVGYGDSYAGDELADAAATARYFGASHTEVRLNRFAFETVLSEVIDSLEEPIATASMVALHHVCARAGQDLKVALIGQGPDELLGGYQRHLGVRYGSAWRSLPAPVQSVTRSVLGRAHRAEALHRGLFALDDADPMRRFQQVFSLLPGSAVDGLFADDVLPPGAGDAILDCWADSAVHMGGDELAAFQYLEVRSSLPDELLLAADKIGMRHSLELRVPYLDHEIIEYAARLPASLKVRRGTRKWLHKRLCRQYLPPEMVRRPKRAFADDVVDRWFRESLSGKLGKMLLADDAPLYSFLRPEPVRQLVTEHQSGHRDHHKIIFSLVVLEEWLRASS